MPEVPIEQQNFVLACFAVNLIQGDNLLRIQLRTDTVEHYLRAAAQLFTERKMENPLDYKEGKGYTNTVISALRKYEEVPNRREPITDEMFY